MNSQIDASVSATEAELLAFASELVRIESPTGQEGEAIQFIADKMRELDYDQVIIDRTGNVIGVIGNGPRKLLFDSHIDHVTAKDPERWSTDPYSGEIKDGKLHGRGSSDMKGSAAATVYAGALVKRLGLARDKTIYVCCSVMEEDYDGEGLYRAIVDNGLEPDYVVICEPSHLQISLGHAGRAVFRIDVPGVSAHGAAPDKGVNAVYKATAIIRRVEELGQRFLQLPGERPSIALTKIESEAVSLNAIPQRCSIYLDRRMTLAETSETVGKELDALVAGTGATWSVHDAVGTSWKGEKIVLHSFLPGWEIAQDHPLTKGCIQAYQELTGQDPVMYKWDFSTNGVATASRLRIPTIGFGAGLEKQAHMTDEYCPLADIIAACKFYTLLPTKL